VCGCTDLLPCIYDSRTGELVDVADPDRPLFTPEDRYLVPCCWVEPDLCSACVAGRPPPLLFGPDGKPLRGAP
jgi:hypothetical protein